MSERWQLLGSLRVLFFVTLAIRILVALTAPPLAQEAYYAEYADHPALSYFDHPPMVAWSIGMGQFFFGYSLLGLRAGSLLFSTGTILLGLFLLRAWGVGRRGQQLWLISTIAVPLFAIHLTLATTDAPLLFFWTLALVSLWRAREGHWKYWALSGAAAGCALLAKYSAAFLLPGALLVLIADARLRAQIARPGPWLALLLAALCFSPVILWNATHDWASFAFQIQGRADRAAATTRWILQLLGGQAGGLGVAAVALGAAGWWALRRWRNDERALWVGAFGLPLPLFMIAISPWTQIKINWLLPGYLALAWGALVWAYDANYAPRSPRLRSFGFRLLLLSAVLYLAAPALRWLPWQWGNTWSGWATIADGAERSRAHADQQDAIADNVFFFSDNHKDAAFLAHALKARHGALPASVLAGNVLGHEGLAYDQWDSPDLYRGHDAICVVRNRPGKTTAGVEGHLGHHFATVEPAQVVEVVSAGVTVQQVSLWICRDYSGAERTPPTP